MDIMYLLLYLKVAGHVFNNKYIGNRNIIFFLIY